MSHTKVELIELAFNENLTPVKYILTDKNTLRPLNNVDDPPSNLFQSPYLQEIGKQLLRAAATGDLSELKAILLKKTPFFSDWLGTSPLHLAAQNNNGEVCKLLLQAGISKDAQNKLEKTPLHLACYEGHTDIVQILLDANVDINCKDILSMTPLHWAVQRSHTEIVKKLIDKGANISIINKFNLTALDIAQQMKVPEIEQLLKKYKRKKNIELTNDLLNESDSSPEAFSAVKLLEQHGITMLTNDHDEQDILNCAAESGHSVILTDVGKELLNNVKHQEEQKMQELSAKTLKQARITPEEFLSIPENTAKSKNMTSPLKTNGIKKRTVQNKSNNLNCDVEYLKQQLSEAKKVIETYKIKLRKKELEAEEYQNKLKLLTNSD